MALENEPSTPAEAAPSGPAVVWQDHVGECATIRVPKGSFAAKMAARELRDADRSIAAIKNLFHHDGVLADRADIYLVDPLAAAVGAGPDQDGDSPPTSDVVGESGIIRFVQPGSVGSPIALPLVHLLIPRWFSGAVARPFVDGVGGVVAARTGSGPSIEEADNWVRSELGADHPVSMLSLAAEPALNGRGSHLSATSFVAFLLANYEAEALARFLASYEPDRRDEAAIAAFQQPLAALDEAWKSRLQRAPKGRTLRQSFATVRSLLTPYRWAYGQVVLLQLLAVALGLVLPLVAGCVVGGLQGVTPGDPLCRMLLPLTTGRLGLIVLVLAVVYCVEAWLELRRVLVEDALFDSVIQSMREGLFLHLQRLPHRFYDGSRLGDLVARLAFDTHTLEQMLDRIFGSGSLQLLMTVAALGVVLVKSPLVGVLLVLILPVFVMVRRRLGTRIAESTFETQELKAEVVAVSQESLSAQSVIKALGMEQRSHASYRSRLLAMMRAEDRLLIFGERFTVSINLALKAGQLVALGAGGLLVLWNRIDAPTVVTLLLLLPQIVEPLRSLSDLPQDILLGAAAVERVQDVLDEPVEIEDPPGAIDLPPLAEELRLEDVSFGYRPDRPALRRVDLRVPAGVHLAVVGASGSGKSTLVNLLLRFWDPDAGQVSLDGVDIRAATLASLRSQIAVVSQETFVFETTIRDNIAVGRPGASTADIEAAAQTARLSGIIEAMPAGYDTVVGDRRVRLSAGQRQRLAVARAVLRDPALLILDEATSALDPETEADLLETLAPFIRARTTISITHRLDLASSANLIVVLDDGRIVEQGGHAALVTAGGRYQAIWEEQTSYLTAGGRPMVGFEASRLRSIPLFSGLGPEALAGLVTQLGLERFAIGEDVFRQGDAGDKLYVIRKGEVDVVVDEGHGERTVNTMRERDYFGELALVTDKPRSATIRAAIPTELYSLSKEDFLALVARESSLRDQLALIANQRRAAYDAAALAAGIAVGARQGEAGATSA